jgi:hypothetical protein
MRNPWTDLKHLALDGGDDSRKAWKNLQASCLLAGHNTSLIDSDDTQPLLMVSRWAHCKGLNNFADAEAWVARMGGLNA